VGMIGLVKKIFINGKFFCQRVTGTQRYARELLHAFDSLVRQEENKDIAIQVLVPRGAESIPRYANLEVRSVGWMRGTKWEQLELPWYCRGHILLTLSGGAPIVHSRNVVTIHDAAVAAVPNGYSFLYRVWHRSICRWMAQTAKRIFTDSHFSKSEIVRWYGAAADKVSVCYLGSDHFSRLQADASAPARFGISGKYILAVSSYNPNKNFHRVVDAFHILDKKDIQLVIIGGNDNRIYRDIAALPPDVRSLGYVSDAELKALYEHAACFVFASLYEGFGLPPLEAMASGCPIVVSRTASLPELFHGAALFCDPYDSKDIAAAIRSALQRPLLSGEESKAFAARYRWNTCAHEILEAIRRL